MQPLCSLCVRRSKEAPPLFSYRHVITHGVENVTCQGLNPAPVKGPARDGQAVGHPAKLSFDSARGTINFTCWVGHRVLDRLMEKVEFNKVVDDIYAGRSNPFAAGNELYEQFADH